MDICTYNSSTPIDYSYWEAGRDNGFRLGCYCVAPTMLGTLIAGCYFKKPEGITHAEWLTIRMQFSITIPPALGSAIFRTVGLVIDLFRHYNPLYLSQTLICTDIATAADSVDTL